MSTWQQPMPPTASAQRSDVVRRVGETVVLLGPQRLRVAVDGRTAAGKTSFGHELAEAIRRQGRPTLRASLDDFKKPWRDAVAKGYDRVTGDGYYRNAPDFDAARTLLLEPAGPDGSGCMALCAFDPLTGEDHRSVTVNAPDDAVLVVDSVFAMRPEYDEFWDIRIWLEVPAELSLARGIERDGEAEGADEAIRLHRDRYQAAEEIYIDAVQPAARADVVVDNADFSSPQLRRLPNTAGERGRAQFGSGRSTPDAWARAVISAWVPKRP